MTGSAGDEFMAMAAAAVGIRQVFDAYVAAGFTESQALYLTGVLLRGATATVPDDAPPQ